MKDLALFDFDGTISHRDSLIDFLRYSFSLRKLIQALIILSPFLIAYKLKLYPNYRAKERLLSYFLKGLPLEDFKQLSQRYSKQRLPLILKKSALERLHWHQLEGHEVVIVSASMIHWLQPWCQSKGIALLASNLQVKNDCLTGKLEGVNCYGQQKVEMIHQNYSLNQYATVYAYGDSQGDKEMLELADHKFFRFFN